MLPLLMLAGVGAGQRLLQFGAQRAQAEANYAATKAANKDTWRNAAQAVGGVNLQRTIARTQTSGERFALRRQASEQLGLSQLSATASGTIGSSPQAALMDIQRQLSEADDSILQNHQITELNLNSSLEDILANARNATRTAAKPQSWFKGFLQSAIGGAGDAAGAYAQQQFALS